MKRFILSLLLVTLSVSSVFAANEITVGYSSDAVLYYLVRRHSDGWVWNTVLNSFSVYTGVHAIYDFQLTDAGGDFHYAIFATGESISAGVYTVQIWKDATNDTTPDGLADLMLGSEEIVWDGTNEQTVIDINGQVELSSTGLDSVSPSYPGTDVSAYDFRDMMTWMYLRFAGETELNKSSDYFRIRNEADNGYISNQDLTVTASSTTVGKLEDGAGD
ncbi:hypothetical protein KAR91_23510 [Candidatus Pacearchaeota archaeon]|nr:hypothetical protein [Candidatus Pacearchaeota archaeon]